MIEQALAVVGAFSARDYALFADRVKQRTLAKDEILLQKDTVCQALYFSLSGAFYQYSITDDNDQNVLDLHLAEEWFLNHRSFIAQRPSESIIQAYTESQVLELSLVALHELIALSPSFFQLGKVMDQASLRIHFFDQKMTPVQKYQHILTHKPDLLQQFPLKVIASYLKITPETLSRVREQLAKGKFTS